MRINLTDRVYCEQCPCSPWSWDLYQIQEGVVRKGETQTVEKPLGIYGMSLEHIIKSIPDIHLQLEGKDLEMKQYIEEFKKIQKQASENIKESINKFKELKQNGII